jgi:hypothetical protein
MKIIYTLKDLHLYTCMMYKVNNCTLAMLHVCTWICEWRWTYEFKSILLNKLLLCCQKTIFFNSLEMLYICIIMLFLYFFNPFRHLNANCMYRYSLNQLYKMVGNVTSAIFAIVMSWVLLTPDHHWDVKSGVHLACQRRKTLLERLCPRPCSGGVQVDDRVGGNYQFPPIWRLFLYKYIIKYMYIQLTYIINAKNSCIF